MGSLPLVSLCLPTYNGSQFLDSTLACIRSLDYPELEIVVSDDASEDSTLQLIERTRLKQAQIYTHSRFGLVGNWNFCLEKARGKYVKFLFQDDLIEPNCVTKMVEIAETNDRIGLVFCRRKLLSDREIDPRHFPENLHLGWSHLQAIQPGIMLLRDANLLGHPHNKIGEPTATLIRREVCDRVGKFDLSLRQYVDLDFWLRIMAHYDVAFIDRQLATFRLHSEQATQKNNARSAAKLEVYRVWLKLLSDPAYAAIDIPTKRRWQRAIAAKLAREFARSLVRRELANWFELSRRLRETLTWQPMREKTASEAARLP